MRDFEPHSQEFDEREITRVQGDLPAAQEDFSAGAFPDLPASSLPRNAIHRSQNYLVFPKKLEPRRGTQRWSNTALPALPGRTTYTWTKTGETITATVGANFVAADVGNYVVHDDGVHERIKAYVNATTVRVEGSTAHAASTAGWVHGRPNGYHVHKRRGMLLMQLSTYLYVARDVYIRGWNLCYRIGVTNLANTHSQFRDMEHYVIVFNSNGIFKVDLNKDPITFFKINEAVPTTLITDTDETAVLIYGKRYSYGMRRLSGTDVTRQSTDGGDVAIEQDSGPNLWNADRQDFGTIYTERPVGDAGTTYGVLTGGDLPAAYNTAAEWAAITNGQFRITIGGTAQNIEVDFTGCTSMARVAETIQKALREFGGEFATATCEYSVATNDHFVFESPVSGGTITEVSAGDAGTDIGTTALACQAGTGTVTNPDYTEPSTVATLTYPATQGCWTHYKVNSTLNIGKDGYDPVSGKANNKELFIWNRDHPVAKAFIASRVTNRVRAHAGTFEATDVGDTIEWQDGTSDTIAAYVNATLVTTSGSGTVAAQAAALGGGDIMTASQTGTTVTRTGGHTFAAGDVGKILFWANGQHTVITEYTNANVVEATPPDGAPAIPSMGVTLDPVSRTYRDRVTDDALRARIAGFSLKNRFHTAMPNCNLGAVDAGMIFGAIEGEERLYHSQIPEYQTYLGGYYDEETQVQKFADQIQALIPFKDDLAIIMNHSTFSVPTNSYTTEIRESVGSVTLALSSKFEVDREIGVKDWGGIRKVGRDVYGMVNNDAGYRLLHYEGGRLKYTDNIARNRYHNDFKRFLDGTLASSYDAINGHLLWAYRADTTAEAEAVDPAVEYMDGYGSDADDEYVDGAGAAAADEYLCVA